MGVLLAALSWSALASASEEDQAVAEMRQASRTVRQLLRTTRKSGRKPSIACVDEALSRVDVATRSAASYAKAAHDAAARNDDSAAQAARARIRQLRDAVAVAANGAKKCVPAPAPPPKVLLATTVKMTVDPSIPPVTP